ncbi:MAG: DapH/DapD/GlmU-related protein [Anaerolineaceae bacterium]|jgi:acetyltransferase-like isoleucine patch superfamily enzyme|nr:DapH/DapD/GlmU-related protein [Anaerolineaceae bacterium]
MGAPYIHPTALVETDTIGDDTMIWAFTHIMKNVPIGSNCNIGDNCFIETGAVVGDNVTIKNGNMLFEGITLEDGVFVGPHVFFTNDRFPRSARLPEAKMRYVNHDWFAPTTIKYGATLGAAAVVLPGIIVGKFAMVGAGAIVTKHIPPHALVIGSPARQIGWVCDCGLKLDFDSTNQANCPSCGKAFQQLDDGIQLIF